MIAVDCGCCWIALHQMYNVESFLREFPSDILVGKIDLYIAHCHILYLITTNELH